MPKPFSGRKVVYDGFHGGECRAEAHLFSNPSRLAIFNCVVVVKTVKRFVRPDIFSFVLSFNLLALLTGSLSGYFFVDIVSCTFLDDRSHRRRRIFCVHTLLGWISPERITRTKEETLIHLV